jgi:quercetin dioxygenase-like cupin family protein
MKITTLSAIALGLALLQAGSRHLSAADSKDAVVLSEALPNVPGKRLTAVSVTYGPGGKSGPHRHAGSVFAFVVSGEVRSQNSVTGPARVYKAGEGFFEPDGSVHLVSENASATKPATLLAVFVADEGATLTTPEPAPAR